MAKTKAKRKINVHVIRILVYYILSVALPV